MLHQKRQVIEALERQKESMIAALWSNSNWDDDKGSRKSAVSDLENNCEEAIQAIKKAGTRQEEPEEVIDGSNPFFAATERGIEKVEKRMGYTQDKKTDEDDVDFMKGLDQE